MSKIVLNVITDQELKKEIIRIRRQKKLSYCSKSMLNYYEAQLIILQSLYHKIKGKYYRSKNNQRGIKN